MGDLLTYGAMGTDPETGTPLRHEKTYLQYFTEKAGGTAYNKS